MSQHQMKAVTKDGQGVLVTLGWDRPLGAYFGMVQKVADKKSQAGAAVAANDDGADDDGASPYVYCNLDDPELADTYGMSPDLDYFVGVLERFGIGVPGAMLDALVHDGLVNAGNRYVLYDAAGNVLPSH